MLLPLTSFAKIWRRSTRIAKATTQARAPPIIIPKKIYFWCFYIFHIFDEIHFQPKLPDCRSKVRRLLSGLWDVQRMQVYQGDSSNIIIMDQSGKDPRYMFCYKIWISFAVTLLRGGTREWRGLPGNWKNLNVFFLPFCQNSCNWKKKQMYF